MLKAIIEEISSRVAKTGGSFAVFGDRRYKPVEFSKDNYKGIGNSSMKKTLFVDGGSAELVAAPGLSLQLVRNAAVIMKDNKLLVSKKREFYVLATSQEKEGKVEARAKIYATFSKEAEAAGGEVGKLCESIRKSSEVKFAAEMVNEVNDCELIVLDGTLEAENEMEKRGFDELYFEAGKKSVLIAAVAKTTNLTTENGSSFAAMLNGRGMEKAWYYHPVVEINSENHKAEMFFTRLHEKSSHVFRAEIYSQQKDRVGEVASVLKENSRELTFPGYPYGMILADKLARVSDKEADYVKAKLFAAAGSKWNGLKKNLAAVNAHEILDGM